MERVVRAFVKTKDMLVNLQTKKNARPGQLPRSVRIIILDLKFLDRSHGGALYL
jgi:hypothetical protein